MSHSKCRFVHESLNTSFKGFVVVETWVDVISVFHFNAIQCSKWVIVVGCRVVRFVVGKDLPCYLP